MRAGLEGYERFADEPDVAGPFALAAINLKAEEVFPGLYEAFYTDTVPHFAAYTHEDLTGERMHERSGSVHAIVQAMHASSRDLHDDWIELANQWLDENAGDAIVAISASVRRRFRRLLIKLRDENKMGPREIVREISRRIPQFSRVRADIWARTELNTGSNYGSFQGARSTSLRLDKLWKTNLDGRERPAHNEANEQRRSLEEPYTVWGEALMYPGDPAASLRNRIRCRCTNLYAPLDY